MWGQSDREKLPMAEGHCVDAEVTPVAPGVPASRH